MNVKAKIQRFWTLSQNRKGFTLVELIVVIAILAILAGVAIPVYNGYIKKAQTAADEQLLDSISTAFAAACVSNGYDHVKAEGTALAVNANGTVATVENGVAAYGFTIQYEGGINATDAAAIVADFAMFFAGNEDAAFKGEEYLGCIVLNGEGNFVSGTQAFKFKGKDVRLNTNSIYALLSNNNFKGKVGEMQGQVSDLANAFAEGYKNKGNDSVIQAFLGDGLIGFLAEVPEDQRGNATVLYIAEQTKNLTTDDAVTVLNTMKDAINNGGADLFTAIDETGVDRAAAWALMYGAATAYANSENPASGFKEMIDGVTGVETFQNMLLELENYPDFLDKYVDGNQLETDMGAYIGALDIMDSLSDSLSEDDLKKSDLWTSDTDINTLLANLGLLNSSN